MKLDERVHRDEAAARSVQAVAMVVRGSRDNPTETIDLRSGPTDAQLKRKAFYGRPGTHDRWHRRASVPRHGGGDNRVRGPNGELEEKSQLWYASESSKTNEVFGGGADTFNVLAWSHPGVQLALCGKLERIPRHFCQWLPTGRQNQSHARASLRSCQSFGLVRSRVARCALAKAALRWPEGRQTFHDCGPGECLHQPHDRADVGDRRAGQRQDDSGISAHPRFLYDQQALRTDGSREYPSSLAAPVYSWPTPIWSLTHARCWSSNWTYLIVSSNSLTPSLMTS